MIGGTILILFFILSIFCVISLIYKALLFRYDKTKSYIKTITEFNIGSKGTLHYILNNVYLTCK